MGFSRLNVRVGGTQHTSNHLELVCVAMVGKNQVFLEGQKQIAAEGNGDAMVEDKMTELIGRLNLTSEECKVLKVVDDVEEGLATSDCAIIGKVLSQSVLHVQTISAA